jgi:hypothetical protein
MNALTPEPTAAPELRCGSCGHPLDATDKYCRECGLPTLHRAALQRAVPTAPLDVEELRRALDAAPDPQPFVRAAAAPVAEPGASEDLTTSRVLNVTSPTFAFQMAGSTLLMVGLIIFLIGLGVLLLVMAIRG